MRRFSIRSCSSEIALLSGHSRDHSFRYQTRSRSDARPAKQFLEVVVRSRKMTRILIIGDAVAPTGFARVIRSVFEPLHQDFELHQLATRYDGRPHDYPWKLYPAAKGKSVYGYDQIVPL